MNEQIMQSIIAGDTNVVISVNARDLRDVIRGIMAGERARLDEAFGHVEEIPTYSREDTQKILGVTAPTLRSWERSGYLMPVRVGRRVLYRRSDINDILYKR